MVHLLLVSHAQVLQAAPHYPQNHNHQQQQLPGPTLHLLVLHPLQRVCRQVTRQHQQLQLKVSLLSHHQHQDRRLLLLLLLVLELVLQMPSAA